jgi:hypothetical protein
LSDDEREQIGLAKAVGHSIGAIAKAIGRPKSTVSRELSRNKLPSGRYSPLHAAGAYQLRRRREARIERDRALRTFVVDRVRSLRVLLIVTFRPDFDPPWVGRAYVTFLAINRLGEREIIAMIEGVIGDKALPANIRQDIIERSDGIPLFVEEMTKAVLEAESQDAVEHIAGAVPSSALAVAGLAERGA